MARINYRTWLGLAIVVFFQVCGLSQNNFNTVYSCTNCKVKEYHPIGEYKVVTDGESFTGFTLFDKQNKPIDQIEFFIVDQLVILNDSTLLTVSPLYGAEIVIRRNKLVVKRYVALSREASNSFTFNQFILYKENLIGSKFLPKRKGYEFHKTSKMTSIAKDKLANIANIPPKLALKIENAYMVILDEFERINIDYSSDKIMKGNIFFAGASDKNLILYHYPTGYLYQLDNVSNLTSALKMPVHSKKDYPYFIYDYKRDQPYFILEKTSKKKILYELYAIDFNKNNFHQENTIDGNIVGASDGLLYMTNTVKNEDFVYSLPLLKEQLPMIPIHTINSIEVKDKKDKKKQ